MLIIMNECCNFTLKMVIYEGTETMEGTCIIDSTPSVASRVSTLPPNYYHQASEIINNIN